MSSPDVRGGPGQGRPSSAAGPGPPAAEPAVILFDGVCSLCEGWVRFVLARDRAARFRFAALQSRAGAELLRRHGLPPSALDTVLLIEAGGVHTRSDAALRILRGLPGAWPLLGWLRIVPRPIRDAVYDFVARHRYAWFGRRESCLVPSPELRARFLE